MSIRQRHVDWCLGLAERNWGAIVLSPIRAAWLDRLTAEHDNLRAALARLELEGDAETGLRLAGSLSPFWMFRGHLSEGRGWLERALARERRGSCPGARPRPVWLGSHRAPAWRLPTGDRTAYRVSGPFPAGGRPAQQHGRAAATGDGGDRPGDTTSGRSVSSMKPWPWRRDRGKTTCLPWVRTSWR